MVWFITDFFTFPVISPSFKIKFLIPRALECSIASCSDRQYRGRSREVKMLSHSDATTHSAPPDGVTCVKPGGRSYVQHSPSLRSRLVWQQRLTYQFTSLSFHHRAARQQAQSVICHRAEACGHWLTRGAFRGYSQISPRVCFTELTRH